MTDFLNIICRPILFRVTFLRLTPSSSLDKIRTQSDPVDRANTYTGTIKVERWIMSKKPVIVLICRYHERICLVFFNDFCTKIHFSKFPLFADDLKMFRIIKSAQDCKSCNLI